MIILYYGPHSFGQHICAIHNQFWWEALWRTFTVKAYFKRSIPHVVKKAVFFSTLGGLTLASSTKQVGNFEWNWANYLVVSKLPKAWRLPCLLKPTGEKVYTLAWKCLPWKENPIAAADLDFRSPSDSARREVASSHKFLEFQVFESPTLDETNQVNIDILSSHTGKSRSR